MFVIVTLLIFSKLNITTVIVTTSIMHHTIYTAALGKVPLSKSLESSEFSKYLNVLRVLLELVQYLVN